MDMDKVNKCLALSNELAAIRAHAEVKRDEWIAVFDSLTEEEYQEFCQLREKDGNGLHSRCR